MTLLVWTNESHGRFWALVEPATRGTDVFMASTKGLAFWVFIGYCYVLMAIGTGLILQMALFSGRVYREQAIGLSVAALLPWVGSGLFVMDVLGEFFNPTNVAFAFSGTLLMGMISHGRLLHTVPAAREVARDEIIQSMMEGVIVIDRDGRVVDLNVAAERIVDHSAAAAIGRPIDELLPPIAELHATATDQSSERGELTISVNGRDRTFDTRVTPLRRSHGLITGQLITLNDVTTQRERKRQIDRQRQRLEVINRVLRHDIRNDVTVIMGNAEHLLDTQDEAVHARKILQKSKDIAKLSEKARKLERTIKEDYIEQEPIDVVEIVEQTVADLGQTYPDAQIQLTGPDEAPACTNELIVSAIRNVIENAIEHNDRSTPTVEVTVTTTRDTNEDIKIAVADDGPGLPSREREIIETGTETALKHSNGLGLWLIYWIVSQSGGTVTLSENEPRGTVITIRLPSAES
jgi:PAS domain S-box-containing protein